MAQKKSKKRPPAPPKTKAPAAPPEAAKMSPQAKGLLVLSVVVALASAGLILYSGRTPYGSALYNGLQVAAYAGMALAGGILVYSCKYNQTKNRLNVQAVGIVFALIGLGNAFWLLLAGRG